MLTKFHHYIFPAVPPAAMLVGVLCDRWLSRDAKPLALATSALGGVAFSYGVYRLMPGQLDGFRGELLQESAAREHFAQQNGQRGHIA